MPAPELSAFGDGSHPPGETGLTVDGGGFGAFPGSLWIYENADRTGNADQLTIGAWNDIELTGVEIPESLNNADGTRYLFLQREDLAWSNGLSFTLEAGSATLTVGNLAQVQALSAPSATVEGTVAPQSIAAIQAFSAVGISQDHQLIAASLAQLQVLESVTPTQTHMLSVSDIDQLQALGPVSLVIAGVLQPLSAAQVQVLESGGLQQVHILNTPSVSQAQVMGAPATAVAGYLSITSLTVIPALGGRVSIKPH